MNTISCTHLVLLNQEGEILWQKKGDKICLPGGKLVHGETYIGGLIREVKEELDFNLTQDKIKPFGSPHLSISSEKSHISQRFYYILSENEEQELLDNLPNRTDKTYEDGNLPHNFYSFSNTPWQSFILSDYGEIKDLIFRILLETQKGK